MHQPRPRNSASLTSAPTAPSATARPSTPQPSTAPSTQQPRPAAALVLFPAGTYLCFSIHLKSNVDLYLAQGAPSSPPTRPNPATTTGYNGGTYDAAEPNDAVGALSGLRPQPLAQLAHLGRRPARLLHHRPRPHLRQRPQLRQPTAPRGNYPIYVAEQAGVGNKSIALKNCRNVLLRDFSILKGGHFGLLLTGVDNLTIDNLTIDTDRDGMDIDCCQNVRVSNCTVNSPWDDGICPKSSYALGYARPTENITITNCYVTGCYELGTVLDGTFKKFRPPTSAPTRTGRIKCGTESNGGFSNITISNCVFEGCQGYALETVDGALLEDIAITNTTMRELGCGPLFLRLGARLRGPKETTKVGTLKRVLISNLVCHNAPAYQGSIISGIPDHAIEDLKLVRHLCRNRWRRNFRSGQDRCARTHRRLSRTRPLRRHALFRIPSAPRAQS